MISQDIIIYLVLLQIFDVIQSDVVLQNQVSIRILFLCGYLCVPVSRPLGEISCSVICNQVVFPGLLYFPEGPSYLLSTGWDFKQIVISTVYSNI